MKLVENWWLVLKHAWSVRFMLIGLALSAGATVLPLMATAIPPEHMLVFCAITFAVVFAAGLTARFVCQDKVSGGDDGTE